MTRSRRSAHTPAAKGSKWIRPSTRWAIYHRDNFRCVYCLGTGSLTLDHLSCVQSNAKDNLPSNLVTACLRCNSKKQALSKRAWFTKLRAMGIETKSVQRRIARAIVSPIDRSIGRFLASTRADTYADEVSEALEIE